MKICLLAYEYPQSPADAIVSGEIKNAYYLARRLHEAGHRLTVVSVPYMTRCISKSGLREGSSPPVYDVPEGRLRSVARYELRIRSLAGFLEADLPAGEFDVVHAHGPALAAAAFRAAGHRPGLASTPVVVTAHGTNEREVRADWTRRGPRYLIRKGAARLTFPVDRRAFGRADAIVSASVHQRDEMVGTYGVDPRRVEVIYNGVDLRTYAPDGNGTAHVDLDHPTILFVGRLVPKKGLRHLLAAMPEVLEAVPGVTLVVVGGSPAFDTCGAANRRQAADLGIAARVRWLQCVPESEMAAFYRSASVAVFPSVNYESLPSVILEAMACGVPVVTTDDWAIPEALGSRHPGLVPQAEPAALAQAIVRFLTRPELAADVRAEQLDRVARFSLDRTAEEYEKLFERVVAVRRS